MTVPTVTGPVGKPSLYVLDALNFLIRAFHALPPLTTTTGQPTGAVYGLCDACGKGRRTDVAAGEGTRAAWHESRWRPRRPHGRSPPHLHGRQLRGLLKTGGVTSIQRFGSAL